jgi:hypothetical protein
MAGAAHLGLSRAHSLRNVFALVGGKKIVNVSKKEIWSAGMAAGKPRRINRTNRNVGVAPIGISMFMRCFAGPSEASTSYGEEPG